MEGGGATVSFCDTPVVSGEAKAFIQRADWIAANVTAKLDFYFLSTAVARGCAAVCHLS